MKAYGLDRTNDEREHNQSSLGKVTSKVRRDVRRNQRGSARMNERHQLVCLAREYNR